MCMSILSRIQKRHIHTYIHTHSTVTCSKTPVMTCRGIDLSRPVSAGVKARNCRTCPCGLNHICLGCLKVYRVFRVEACRAQGQGSRFSLLSALTAEEHYHFVHPRRCSSHADAIGWSRVAICTYSAISHKHINLNKQQQLRSGLSKELCLFRRRWPRLPKTLCHHPAKWPHVESRNAPQHSSAVLLWDGFLILSFFLEGSFLQHRSFFLDRIRRHLARKPAAEMQRHLFFS